MARSFGAHMPPELLEKLRNGAMYRSGTLGLPIITLDEHGWPHVAMAAGAAAAQPDEVWVAFGGKTGSLANAGRDRRVTVIVAGPETLYYVKGEAEVVRQEMCCIPGEAAVRLRVTDVLQDSKPFLTITGGVSYAYKLMAGEYEVVIAQLLDELQSLADQAT